MTPTPEREEQAYLESIQEKLREAVARADYGVRQVATELKGHQEYLYENRLDAADKASMRQTVNRVAATGEAARTRLPPSTSASIRSATGQAPRH